MTSPAPTGVAASQCKDLMRRLPDEVADQDQRTVQPAEALAAAWGDPPIVLRCGVKKPALLRPDSSCFVANDVGWFAELDGRPLTGLQPVDDDVVFTTVGRSAYVEVTVPPTYEPAADALVDLTGAISAATQDLRPCL